MTTILWEARRSVIANHAEDVDPMIGTRLNERADQAAIAEGSTLLV
jgi:hypothetical protein